MAGGLVASLFAIALGAILDFAVTVNNNQHGFNVNKVGLILMIVGVIGFVISIIGMMMDGHHKVDSQMIDNQGRAAEFHQEIK